MRTALAVCVCMSALVGVCDVFASVTIEGAMVRLDMTEPTTNSDGTPLKDLKETVGLYVIPGQNEAEAECGRAPATAVTGGGAVTIICEVPVGSNQEADVKFRARAIDLVGNESMSTPDVILRIDHLPPGAPSL